MTPPEIVVAFIFQGCAFILLSWRVGRLEKERENKRIADIMDRLEEIQGKQRKAASAPPPAGPGPFKRL